MYFELFSQMKKTLGQIDTWLVTAEAHAKAKGFDPIIYANLRLAPDQLPFARQLQVACDATKLGASRLTGKEAPAQPDTEQTIDELRARVAAAIAYLDSFSAKDFEASASRMVTQPRWQGKGMTGANYFLEHVVPNFFFHASHVYAILRHNGVPLGTADYLGALTFQPL